MHQCSVSSKSRTLIIWAGRRSVNIPRQKHVQRKETLLFWCLIFSGQISCSGCRNEGRASDTHTHTRARAQLPSQAQWLHFPNLEEKNHPAKLSLSLRHISGAGINSDACHVWNIVGLHWKLRKMDGTIKVRVKERDLSEMERVWERRRLYFCLSGAFLPLRAALFLFSLSLSLSKFPFPFRRNFVESWKL